MDGITSYLGNLDWEKELDGLATEDTWIKIREHITEAVDLNVQKTKPRPGNNRKKWLNGDVLASVKRNTNYIGDG